MRAAMSDVELQREVRKCGVAETVFVGVTASAIVFGAKSLTKSDWNPMLAVGYVAAIASVASVGFDVGRRAAKEQLKKRGVKSDKDKRREIASYDIFLHPKAKFLGIR